MRKLPDECEWTLQWIGGQYGNLWQIVGKTVLQTQHWEKRWQLNLGEIFECGEIISEVNGELSFKMKRHQSNDDVVWTTKLMKVGRDDFFWGIISVTESIE